MADDIWRGVKASEEDYEDWSSTEATKPGTMACISYDLGITMGEASDILEKHLDIFEKGVSLGSYNHYVASQIEKAELLSNSKPVDPSGSK
jgi:hypothetical protein